MGKETKQSNGDFDSLLNNPEQNKRTRESARLQYTDAEIEELYNQKPLTTTTKPQH